ADNRARLAHRAPPRPRSPLSRDRPRRAALGPRRRRAASRSTKSGGERKPSRDRRGSAGGAALGRGASPPDARHRRGATSRAVAHIASAGAPLMLPAPEAPDAAILPPPLPRSRASGLAPPPQWDK